MHPRFEDLEPVLSVGLRRIHGDIRVAEHLVRRVTVRAGRGDPDAGPDEELLSAVDEGRLELGEHPPADVHRRLAVDRVLDENRELVAAHPGDRVARPDARA